MGTYNNIHTLQNQCNYNESVNYMKDEKLTDFFITGLIY